MRQAKLLSLAGMLTFGLNGCIYQGPVSTLTDTQEVSVSGKVLKADGSAWANGRIELKVKGQTREASTDSSGQFGLKLTGAELKDRHLSAPVEFKIQDASGAAIELKTYVLKADMQLPVLQFWDQLQSPTAGTAFTDEGPLKFSWSFYDKNSLSPDTSYLLRVLDQNRQAMLEKRGNTNQAELPSGVFEADQAYQWQVEVRLPAPDSASDTYYRKRTRLESFKTPATSNSVLKIADIQLNSKPQPLLHDGLFKAGASFERADVKQAVAIDLSGPQNLVPIQIDLGTATPFKQIAIYRGTQDFGIFGLAVSDDGKSWATRASLNDRGGISADIVSGPVMLLNLPERKRYLQITLLYDREACTSCALPTEIRVLN